MEEQEIIVEKEKDPIKRREARRRIPSTVILGILAVIVLILSVILIAFNISATIKTMADQASGDNAGAAVAIPLAAMVMIMYGFGISIINIGLSVVGVIFSSLNIPRAPDKAVRILNIIYTCIFGSAILWSILKMILIGVGVA